MRVFLALRSITFVILVPGTVAGVVPFSILQSTGRLDSFRPTIASVAPALLALAGACVLLRCVWDFFDTGHGTLLPLDPPKRLVVRGLYRFTRNPMYNGVLALIGGLAWLLGSLDVAAYGAVVFLFFHLMVVFYEEPALASRFGESYAAYRHAVPRWGFTARAYRDPDYHQ